MVVTGFFALWQWKSKRTKNWYGWKQQYVYCMINNRDIKMKYISECESNNCVFTNGFYSILLGSNANVKCWKKQAIKSHDQIKVLCVTRERWVSVQTSSVWCGIRVTPVGKLLHFLYCGSGNDHPSSGTYTTPLPFPLPLTNLTPQTIPPSCHNALLLLAFFRGSLVCFFNKQRRGGGRHAE